MGESELNEFLNVYKKVIQGKKVDKKFIYYGNEFLKNPYIWGNVYWNILHNISYKIDSLTKIEKNLKFTLLFLNVLKNLNTILPCDTCANSYQYTFECASKLKLFYEKFEFDKNEMLQKLVYYLHTCVNIKKIGALNEIDTLKIFMDEINDKESIFQTFHRLFPNHGFVFFDQSKKLRKPININAFIYFYHTFYQQEKKEYKDLMNIIKQIY